MKYEVYFLEGVPFEVEPDKYYYTVLPRSSTVLVKTIDDKQNYSEKRYGFADLQEIYKLIDEGKEINLNHTYVGGFSLEDYRINRNLDKYSPILLNLSEARNAFFDNGGSLEKAMGRESYPKKDVPGYKSVDFSGAQFDEGNVYFFKTQFGEGNVNFSYAQFGKGDVHFSGVQFSEGDVSFSRVQFDEGNMYFLNAQFGEGDVNFSYAQFGKGGVYFREAQFSKGNVDFSYAQFGKGSVLFLGTQFGKGNVNFLRTWLGKGSVSISFINNTDEKLEKEFETTITFSSCVFREHTNMYNIKCKSLIIENCIIEKTLNLESLTANELSLKNTKNLGQIFIRWKEDKVQKILSGDTEKDRADQFLMLKENYHAIGRYDEEDEAYVEYKRCQWKARHAELSKEKKWLQKIKFLFHWLEKIFFDLMGQYGTSPRNVAYSMGVVFAAFTTLYCTMPSLLITNGGTQPSRTECISYSIATFLTIGYGNITPAHKLAVILSGVEGFAGVFLIAYFTVAFARKVLR